ncbi:hypothetical protein G5S52_06845 [Grimontia sp. S25]|uniref:Uncharacterized protein n=1 Tax=Grimontia sedimenti TaxID=2711294 RepID=A0A6M1RB99_9GAMM|nr:hypothetical protein [Grimontia sedimenti]NGN97390.1 hypothetical protein [Grimontia sedimenti]
MAIALNMTLFFAAQMQQSKWIGTVAIGDQAKLTRTTQYMDTIDIRVTDYHVEHDPKKLSSFHVGYQFELQKANRNLLLSESLPLKSTLHTYYALDERCTLVFLTPKRQSIEKMSLGCLY